MPHRLPQNLPVYVGGEYMVLYKARCGLSSEAELLWRVSTSLFHLEAMVRARSNAVRGHK